MQRPAAQPSMHPVMLPGREPVRRATVGAWTAELLPRAPYEAAYTPEGPVIGFAFESQSGDHAFGSDRRVAFRAVPNGLGYVPAGCDVYSLSGDGGEYLRLSRGCEGGGALPDRRFSDLVDAPAIAAAHHLRRLLLAPVQPDPLEAERAIAVLAQAVAAAGSASLQERAVGWMTPARLRRVEELIESTLDEAPTVAWIAARLGLSAGFFSRSFRAAVGTPPHQFILDRRLARARHLLVTTSRGLSDVALACGFCSHAHMSAVFRSRLGIAPSRLRGAAAPDA